MHTDPRNRLREVRLARALAGSELHGLRAIEEIHSIARLAQHHTDGITREEVDLTAIGGAFSAIERHAKDAERLYGKMLEVCYEYLHAGEDEASDGDDDDYGDGGDEEADEDEDVRETTKPRRRSP